MDKDKEDLIIAYLRDKLSAEERALFEAWRTESGENRNMVEHFRQVWQLTRAPEAIDFETDQEWARLHSTITTEKKTLAFQRIGWLKVAASIALLLSVSFVLYLTLFGAADVRIDSADQTVRAALPDGTYVWLNRGSTLRYRKAFTERLVQLSGEGFFEVRKDADHPFVVEAAGATVEVLGTSFNVRSYDADPTEVFVVTGKVSLAGSNKDHHIVLNPGMTGVFDKKQHALMIDSVQETNALAWKDKRLVFRKAPLKRVVKVLDFYFNTQIGVVNEKLLECRFTGTFDDPTLKEVVETLGLALEIDVSVSDGFYTLDGQGCGGR